MSVSDRRLPEGRWLPIGLVLILILSGSASSQLATASPTSFAEMGVLPSSEVRPISPAAYSPINTTLTVSNSSVNLSNLFYGTTLNNEVRLLRGETNAVNATPARVLVWPGAMAGEDYNPLTNIHYDTYNGTPKRALTNESQFVDMCKATRCTAIVQVPAEIDNPKLAEQIVNYTEVNLSFQPAYWMIGNEPELWSHWQVPWNLWPSTFTAGPTPAQFGSEVLAYVKAIRAVDNTTPILGLPASGCTCGSWTFEQWISGVLNVTGAKIQAVAFHEYPAGWLGTGDGSLHDFYGTLQGAASIPPRMIGARQAVQSACHGCNVSVFISEIGSALSWSSYGQYAAGFSGALSLASQMTQAMDFNLTNVDLFATELATKNSWFDPTGYARPDYALYTQILDHLGTRAFPVNLTGLDHTVYGIDTVAPNDQRRGDLLVVNDNISKSISFTPRFAESYGTSPVEAWSWNGSIHHTGSNSTTWVEPYTPNPVPQEFPVGLPGTYTLPPQSMVLFEAYPSGGTYVRVLGNGVPSPTPWYTSVGSRFFTTTAGNISLLLPSGSYPVASVGIPLPLGGKERNPSERLEPYVASPVHVSGTHTNITIDFAPQWRVNVTASPGDGGTVRPNVGWWNASEPLNLSVVTPAHGYAFVGWSGWGPGSANGTKRSITIVPAGPLVEKARFVVGNEVDLVESGLPTGTPWSVTVRGFTTNTSTSNVSVFEPAGRHGYSVSPIPGYRVIPRNGAFTVSSAWSLVRVKFVPITPPPPAFPVTFHITGLPASMAVSITVRSATQTMGASDPRFQLLNGIYSYDVGYVAGYHPDVALKAFYVHYSALTVDVPFVPTEYHATWEATGFRSGMNWSVVVNGTPFGATSAWASTLLPNGSYSYTIEPPANYSESPRTGVLSVTGSAMYLYLQFTLVQFPASFDVTGMDASMAWSVRLGNLTQHVSANRSSFLAPNGTYTFDVHPPAGYYAIPSHGRLTIAGPTTPVVISFHLTSQRPTAALVAALSSGALMVSVWIGASTFVGFATLRWLRRRGG